MKIKRLTRAEEEIMLVLWRIGESVVRDVIAELKQDGIPYTTVSTVIRVLERKGFIGHRAVGNTYLYFPLISKEEYLKDFLPGIVGKYFNGSFTELASFFARENHMDMKELSELIESVIHDQEKDADIKKPAQNE